MRAILLTGYGGVDRFELGEAPDNAPGPDEVKVRVVGAGINPFDWKLRRGDFKAAMPLEFPAILGRDASGEVVQVGAGVSKFRVGDRVLGLVTAGYAEFVIAKAEAFAEVPDGLDLCDAGALPLALLTGAQLIYEGVKPKVGDVVLVTGAVGSVGRAAVYSAKALGARVWAGVRAKQKAEAEKLGAEGVVALDEEADIARLPPLDAIADTVFGETVARLLAHVKTGGMVASGLGEVPGAKERGLRVHVVYSHPDSLRLGELAAAVASGALVIPIARRFPLAQASAAQEFAENRAGGKVLLAT